MHATKRILDLIVQKANNHKIIAIGEIHGVKENPEVVLEVYNALSEVFVVTIGFEYPQSVIDNPEDVEEILFQDGRYSEYHKKLLEGLKQRNVNMFGFDLNSEQIEEQKTKPIDWRDKIMAENTNKQLETSKQEEKILLVTGDMHYQTKIQNIMYPDSTGVTKPIEYLPMGAQLKVDSILAIHLRYLSGQFYNFKLRQMPKITANKDHSFRQQDELIEIDIIESNPTIQI